ncbi:hypothetical protein M9Y10_030231 [Tritrichomonas musculus]|uniref:Uncharacterized protein n=1 Tax=Tritrichomonas musculus TaxID=1915356 RepID=A0ABR2KPY2_9EUKA
MLKKIKFCIFKFFFLKKSVTTLNTVTILKTLLYYNHQYEVQSNVSEEVFLSFKDFLKINKQPDIKDDNIIEYDILYREFKYGKLNEILSEKRKTLKDYSQYINDISDNRIKDKSSSEAIIANNLDDCLDKNGNSLFLLPINNLYNIFKLADYKFNKHDKAYELIIKQYENNDQNVLILIPLIDGSKLNSKNLENALQNSEQRFGLIPHMESQYINQIRKDLDELKDKQNSDEASIRKIISDIELYENKSTKIQNQLDELIQNQEKLYLKMYDEFKDKLILVDKMIKRNADKQKQSVEKLKNSFNKENNHLKNKSTQICDEIKALQQQIDQNKNEQNQKNSSINDILTNLKKANESKFELISQYQKNNFENLTTQIKNINIEIEANDKKQNEKNSKLQNDINMTNDQIKSLSLKNIDLQNENGALKQQIEQNNNEQNQNISNLKEIITNLKKSNEKQLESISKHQQEEFNNITTKIKNINKKNKLNDSKQNTKYSNLERNFNSETNQIKKMIDDNVKQIDQYKSEQTQKSYNIEITMNKIIESNEKLADEISNHEKLIKDHFNDFKKIETDIKGNNTNCLKLEKRIADVKDEQNKNRKYFECSSHLLFSLMCNYKSKDSYHIQMTRTGPGILSYLASKSKNIFDHYFIVSLSNRDPYNILLPKWNGAYYSQKSGDFSLEFIFKDPINLIGFEIEGINDFILKNYEIIINDEESVLYRTLKNFK